MDFARVLSQVAVFLDSEKARFGLAGAVALNAYGIARATTDLDLVIEDKVKARLLDFMDSLGYERLQVSDGFSVHLHKDTALGRLDFLYLDSHTADVLFTAAVRTRFAGVEILVVSPEHLAAMKAQAIQSNPSRLHKDLADVQALLQVPGVDVGKMRGYFEKRG